MNAKETQVEWQTRDEMLYPTNPLQRLNEVFGFTSRDCSEDKMIAFMYGIICGWDDDSYEELKEKHGWSNKEVELQKMWHENYKKAWNAFMALESKLQPLAPEAVREEAEKRYPFATSNDHNERLTNYVHKEMQNIFIEGATFASIPRFKEQEIRLLTAMVIEMKNEISQTVRHCQAQAIINKLKDEHTL